MAESKEPASKLFSVRIPSGQLERAEDVFRRAPMKKPAYVIRALVYYASRKPMIVAHALAAFAVYEQKGGET
ncbi:MAG: hypothetical protein EOP85_00715 [Verrucomicrobiaceae bacterium]|nr:MAG: hypothetical protein EOP85_00715 [Verrucomicrobiaceae bacterium]